MTPSLEPQGDEEEAVSHVARGVEKIEAGGEMVREHGKRYIVILMSYQHRDRLLLEVCTLT